MPRTYLNRTARRLRISWPVLDAKSRLATNPTSNPFVKPLIFQLLSTFTDLLISTLSCFSVDSQYTRCLVPSWVTFGCHSVCRVTPNGEISLGHPTRRL